MNSQQRNAADLQSQLLRYCLPRPLFPCRHEGRAESRGGTHNDVRDVVPQVRTPRAAPLPQDAHALQLLGGVAAGQVHQLSAEEQGVVVVAAGGPPAALAPPRAAAGGGTGSRGRAAHCAANLLICLQYFDTAFLEEATRRVGGGSGGCSLRSNLAALAAQIRKGRFGGGKRKLCPAAPPLRPTSVLPRPSTSCISTIPSSQIKCSQDAATIFNCVPTAFTDSQIVLPELQMHQK